MNTLSKRRKSIRNVLIILCWISLVVLCLLFRDEITVERIVGFTPRSQTAAAVVMICLFAIKSVSVVVYGGMLYAASGILFELPLALAVNTIGTIIMISLPYRIGKHSGQTLLSKLIDKYPKLSMLRDMPQRKPFFTSFLVRIVGILPSDIVGMYFGCTAVTFRSYLLGSLMGLLPAVVSFSIMGTAIHDPTSPAFLGSVGFEIGLMVLSLGGYLIWKRIHKNIMCEFTPRKEGNL